MTTNSKSLVDKYLADLIYSINLEFYEEFLNRIEYKRKIIKHIDEYVNQLNLKFIERGLDSSVIIFDLEKEYECIIKNKLKNISVKIPTCILISFDDGSQLKFNYTKNKKEQKNNAYT